MIKFARGGHGVGDPEQAEGERRDASILQFGVVHEVDYAKALARVAIGDEEDENGHLLTGWLPMAGGRAQGDSDWHPLEPGERVMVLAESGETQNGMVLPAALYTDESPAPGAIAGLWRKRFADGATIEYDRNTGAFLVDAKSRATLAVGSASIRIEADEIVIAVGGVSLKLDGGGLAISGGAVTHGGKGIGKDHRHGQVQPGGGLSGVPL